MGAAGSLIPPGTQIGAVNLGARYAHLLQLPTDASDLSSPEGASPEQFAASLNSAREHVLYLKSELLKLQSGCEEGKSGAVSQEQASLPSQRRGGRPRLTLDDICTKSTDKENLKECIAWVSHIRQLLHYETAAAERRRKRRLSHEGHRLYQNILLTTDSDTNSEDSLEDLPRREGSNL